MFWPPLSPNQAVPQTCRTWLLSTSQTSGLWSSWRSSSCRVSHLESALSFDQHLPICLSTKVTHCPPASSRSLFPVQQWPDTQPLLLSKTGWANVPGLLRAVYFWTHRIHLCSFCLPVVVSLSQMGKASKAACGAEFCGPAHRLQLCPPNHWAHQVSARRVMFNFLHVTL